MADVGISAEEESHPRNPINNEEGNIRDGKIWINLNEVTITHVDYKK